MRRSVKNDRYIGIVRDLKAEGWLPEDCRYQTLKSRATALKWLLVVAFGYAGYKRSH